MALKDSVVDSMKSLPWFVEICHYKVKSGIAIWHRGVHVYVIQLVQPGQDYKDSREYPFLPKNFREFLEVSFFNKTHPQAFVCDHLGHFAVIDILPGKYRASVDGNGNLCGESWYASFCLQRLEERYHSGEIDKSIEFFDKMSQNLPKREMEAIQGLFILQSGVRIQ